MCDLASAAENVRAGVDYMELRRGDRFRVPGCSTVWTFSHIDGMYGKQYDDRGDVWTFSCRVPVELLEMDR